MTARATWKAWERRIASIHADGRRIPVTGIDRADRDAEGGMFWYQAKLRKALPAWLFDWLDGITAAAKPEGKIGVLVIRKPRMDDNDALVILRWSDWRDLHGTPTTRDEVL